jgi:hypothetical protein
MAPRSRARVKMSFSPDAIDEFWSHETKAIQGVEVVSLLKTLSSL